MTEQATFTILDQDGVPVVEVNGEVDIRNIAQFGRAVLEAASHDRGLVVSLFSASYLDSRMVHEIFTLQKRFRKNRQMFVLVWPDSRSTRVILEMTAVSSAVDVYDSVELAVDAVRNASAG